MAKIHYEYYKNLNALATLVLVAGSSDGIQRWLPLLELVKKHFNVLVIDNPGVGKSDVRKVFTAKSLAIEYLEIIQSLGIEKFCLWGHSFGSFISLEMIDLKPNMVERFVCISGGVGAFMQHKIAQSQMEQVEIIVNGNGSQESKLEAYGLIIGGEGEKKRKLTKAWMEHKATLAKGVLYSFASASYRHAFFARLAKIKVPTLIVHGNEDAVVDFENAKILLKMLENAQLLEVKGGHYPDYQNSNIAPKMLSFTKGEQTKGLQTDCDYQIDIEKLAAQEAQYVKATSNYEAFEPIVRDMFSKYELSVAQRLQMFIDFTTGK